MLVKLSSAKHQNLYGLVKALLERVSPLMIDSSAIIELSNILRRGLESELEIRGVSEEQAIERGLYLLIVSKAIWSFQALYNYELAIWFAIQLFSCSYGPAFKTQETLDTIVFMLAQGHILAGINIYLSLLVAEEFTDMSTAFGRR